MGKQTKPVADTTHTASNDGLGAADRYSRQTLFPGIGRAGQEQLGRACVLIVGCGALGTGLANNLARAGVGTLRIADRD
ncbi:MAG: ThiF family adenylyltransferase, partial [Ktedonobacterales bacterium]